MFGFILILIVLAAKNPIPITTENSMALFIAERFKA